MKYTIHGFSQRKAIELNLDNDELLLLRWIVDFSATGQMEYSIHKNKIYYWVNYKTLCDELPILAVSKDRIYRKLKNLCNAKVLKHHTVKVNGTYSYYAFDESLKELVSDNFIGGYGKNTVGGTVKITDGVRQKNRTKDSSIILNQSTKKSHTDISPLCVDLSKNVEKILGEKVSQKKLQELINSKGADIVQKYIDEWDKYRQHANSTQSAYFIYAVQNELPVPQAKVKTINGRLPNYANFDQREYTEEELEPFYISASNKYKPEEGVEVFEG